jgi:glycosyltransferase involved in cell wall biosynthesis
MRIGLLYPTPDPLSPANWSGSPHGLAGGLRDIGVEVVPLGAKLPPVMHQAVAVLSRITGKRGAVAERTPVRQSSRTWALSRRLRAAAPTLDGVIAMGLELYDLGAVRLPDVPVATFDDGTLIQQWNNKDSDIRQSGFPEDEVRLWFERQGASARAANVCCVATNYAARSFVDDYRVSADHVRVVGMGHRPRASGTAVRDWSTPRFLFVGVDWQRKNGEAVLRAFERVRQEYPTATLDLVGDHPFVDRPGVRDHGFLARQDGESQRLLDSLFASSTAFVLPSRFDLSPIAYMEAASAGMPVVATAEGGAGEVLGEAAVSVHPDSPDELAAAMLRLADPTTAESLGATAKAAAATASWAHVAKRIVDALETDSFTSKNRTGAST